MTDINLRNYVSEIDAIIESGQQLEQAISHCRHILTRFPKHIDTYRLLGKAFLELNRNNDAVDIFKRVLSTIPDDFVSHIGTSIIREDEGKLDEAIHHMERAFESNPANSAIQQELRRLIGRRDGIEPQKVRLTRGALARVYAHGDLLPQAIAEIQAALTESPNRVDLQVLLADLYLKVNQTQDAGELSFRILEKLPNSLIANRIAAFLLQQTGRDKEAVTYLNRLHALDPYFAFLENPLEDPQAVPADSIPMQKGDGLTVTVSADESTRQPGWATSLGLGFDGPQNNQGLTKDTPTWLDAIDPETSSAEEDESPSIHPFAGADKPVKPDIPNWMREAGWTESSGEFVDQPISFSDEEMASLDADPLPPQETELVPAELPDWLSEVPTDNESPESGIDPPAAGWQSPESAATESDLPAEALPDELRIDPTDIPVEQDSSSATFPPELTTTADAGESVEVPKWLEDSQQGATETIVAWLGDRSREDFMKKEEKELPEWMDGTGPLAEKKKAVPASAEPLASEPIDPVPEPPTPAAVPETEEPTAYEDEESIPDEMIPESVVPESADTEDEIPDWLHAISAPEPDSAGADARAIDADAPDWIQNMADQVDQPPQHSQTIGEVPDWLEPSATPSTPASIDNKELPDWLTQPTDDIQSTPLDVLESETDEMEWLSEQPAETEDSIPTPEERPQWVSEITGETLSTDSDSPVPTESSDLDWLGDLIEPAADEIPASDQSTDDIDWLEDLIEEQEPRSEEIAADQAQSDWLDDIVSEPDGIQAIEEPAKLQDTIDWLVENSTEESTALESDSSITVSAAEDQDSDISSRETLVSARPQEMDEAASHFFSKPTLPSARLPGIADVPAELDAIEEPEISFEPPPDIAAQAESDLDSQARDLLQEITDRPSGSDLPSELIATAEEIELLKMLDETPQQDIVEQTVLPPEVPDSESISELAEEPAKPEPETAPEWLIDVVRETGPLVDYPEETTTDAIPLPASDESAFTDIPTDLTPDEVHPTSEDVQDIAPVTIMDEKTSELEEAGEDFSDALAWLEQSALEVLPDPEPAEDIPVMVDAIPAPQPDIQEEETTAPSEPDALDEADLFTALAAEEPEVIEELPESSEMQDQEELTSDLVRTPDMDDQTETESIPIIPEPSQDVQRFQETGILADHIIPEDVSVGLEWLNQLADSHEPVSEEPVDEAEIPVEADPPETVTPSISDSLPEDTEIQPAPDTVSIEATTQSAPDSIPVEATVQSEAETAVEFAQESPEPTDSAAEDKFTPEQKDAIVASAPSEEAHDVEQAQSVPDEVPEIHLPKTWKISLSSTTPEDQMDAPAESFQESIPADKLSKTDPTILQDAVQKAPTTEDTDPAPNLTLTDEEISRISAELSEEARSVETEATIPAPAEDETAATDFPEDKAEKTVVAAAPISIANEELSAEITDELFVTQELLDAIAMETPPAEVESDATTEDEAPTIDQVENETLPSPAEEIEPVSTSAEVTSSEDQNAPPPDAATLDPLTHARQLMSDDLLDEALQVYGQLIKKRISLDALIPDLELALEQSPVTPLMWQTLGDAYMHNDQLAAAIEAYQHGMDVA